MEPDFATLERQYPHQHREHRLVLPEDVEGRIEFSTFYEDQVSATIVNLSEYGARAEISDIDNFFTMGSTLKSCRILVKGALIFEGRAVVINEVPAPSGKHTFGIATESPIDLDKVRALISMSNTSFISSTNTTLQLSAKVNSRFKLLVSDLILFLSDLKYRFSQEQEAIVNLALGELKSREDQILTLAMSLYGETLNLKFLEFQNLISEMDTSTLAVHKQYFQTIFLPFMVKGSPFSYRALTKPLGYPGDFGLMVMLYEYEDSGDTIFHKFWHRYCCHSPAALANKNRVHLLNRFLSENYGVSQSGGKPYKVATIACGPAREIELFLKGISEKTPRQVEVVCIDQEEAAIEYAQLRIKPLVSAKTSIRANFFVEDAVLGTIRKRPFVKAIEGSQVIISAGLFDYLADRVALKMISVLYGHLAPGGVLLIGNVSEHNPDVFPMNFLMDWNLILRTPDSLRALAMAEVGKDPGVAIEVISEDLGLNLFLKIKKPNS